MQRASRRNVSRKTRRAKNASFKIASPTSAALAWNRTTLGYAFVFSLLWLTILAFPWFPSNALESSWRMILSYAVSANLQFGKEIIFNYGPLGFLMEPIYTGNYFYTHLVWQACSAAIFALIIMRTGYKCSPARSIFYYLYFLAIGTIYNGALYIMMIVLVGLDLIRESAKDTKLFPLGMSGFLAISSLLKFTNLLVAISALGCSCSYDLICKRWRRALFTLGGYCLIFISTWLALGQNPMNIPRYIFNSLEISRGYNEAQALNEVNPLFYFGLATILPLLVYSLLSYISHADKIKSAFLLSIFLSGLYLEWKHGFIRADRYHLAGFFIYSLLPVVAFPVFLEEGASLMKSKIAMLLITAVPAVLATFIVTPGVHRARLPENLESLATLTRLHSIYEEKWRNAQAGLNMPRTRQEIGAASVDVLGLQQGIALFNGFHYTPRPALQSYVASTARLIEANHDFYKRDTAPDYVLQRYDTVDRRFPTLDDADLLNILFTDYAFLFVENDYLLWKKQTQTTKTESFTPKFYRREMIHFNERIELAELTNGNVWLAVKYEPSWLGRIRALLYKPPFVTITVFNGQTELGTFRLVGEMATQGFLLNPLIEEQVNLLDFLAGRNKKPVSSFSIDIPSSAQKFYENTMEIRLYSLPPFTPASH
jgi:hypothetical protein